MIGYKLVKIDKPPAEAWRELKETANELAVSLTACWREICQQVREACGQSLYRAELPGISIGDERLCVRAGDRWLWLPRTPREHWDFRASQVREAIERMASLTRDMLQRAADEALEQ